MPNNQKRTNNDDALPTQAVSSDAEVLRVAAIQAPDESQTTGLMIVSFYLPERADPIVVTGSNTITIGRRDPKRKINPTLDLTEDNGAKLGVSRVHAELVYMNGKYHLKDTGSSNGSWVNDTKLAPYATHPVSSGDQIRIGQLAITVHITVPQNIGSNSDVISTIIGEPTMDNVTSYQVIDTAGGILVENGVMNISKLRTISTYLERVSRIHQLIRDAQRQNYEPLSVRAIRLRKMDNSIVVDVESGHDVMNFMAEKLPEFLIVLEGRKEGTQKQTDSLQRYHEPLEQIADYTLQELVFRFLNEERDEYVRKLAVHYDAILAMDLQLKQTN